jgi:hypothetical protein
VASVMERLAFLCCILYIKLNSNVHVPDNSIGDKHYSTELSTYEFINRIKLVDTNFEVIFFNSR